MTLKKSVLSAIVVGLIGFTSVAFSPSNSFEVVKNLELFSSIIKELNHLYVDDIDYERIVNKGLTTMLKDLDPYTTYYSEKDIEGYRVQTTGRYGGIGALIRKDNDYVIIAEPYEGFPAQKAGLKAGDKIIEIDGESAKGFNTDTVSSLLKGTPGTTVEITILRAGEDDHETVTLIREEVVIDSVPFAGYVAPTIGYIRLTNFTPECGNKVREAFVALKREPLEGLILDLRSNPGGLLQEAVEVCSVFLPKGTNIVNTRGKNEDKDKYFRTKNAPIDLDLPLTILVSRGSASASEIVAGVLQDFDRAVIVGERSFGKGLVQSTRELGYNSKLKITTSKYYLPSGRCVQAIDYSGKYKDGADKIPDSLRTKYYTENGRIVLDAGGIDPDMPVENELYSLLSSSLISKGLLFGFASDYETRNSNISQPSEFRLTDQDYQDFKTYIASKEYNYMTYEEGLVEKMEEKAEQEGLTDNIASQLGQLKTSLESEKADDLDEFKEEILTLLEEEIVSRYYFQKGRIENSIHEDKVVLQALAVLQDNQAKTILQQN